MTKSMNDQPISSNIYSLESLFEISQQIHQAQSSLELLNAYLAPLQAANTGVYYGSIFRIETNASGEPIAIIQLAVESEGDGFPNGTRFDLEHFEISKYWTKTGGSAGRHGGH